MIAEASRSAPSSDRSPLPWSPRAARHPAEARAGRVSTSSGSNSGSSGSAVCLMVVRRHQGGETLGQWPPIEHRRRRPELAGASPRRPAGVSRIEGVLLGGARCNRTPVARTKRRDLSAWPSARIVRGSVKRARPRDDADVHCSQAGESPLRRSGLEGAAQFALEAQTRRCCAAPLAFASVRSPACRSTASATSQFLQHGSPSPGVDQGHLETERHAGLRRRETGLAAANDAKIAVCAHGRHGWNFIRIPAL